MFVKTPVDMIVYELGSTRALERSGDSLLSAIAERLGNRALAQVLHEEEDSRHEQAANIDACLEALGRSPLEQAAPTVEAQRERFFSFARLQPSADVLDLYALGTAHRLAHAVIAGYRDMIDLTVLAGEARCRDRLQENLTHKEEYTARLEHLRHEIGQKLLAPA